MPKPITPQSVILNSKPIQNHLLRLESLKFIIKNFPLIIPLLRLYSFPILFTIAKFLEICNFFCTEYVNNYTNPYKNISYFFHCLIYCYPLQ